MKFAKAVVLASVLSLSAVEPVHAQYEGTNAKYAAERRADRREMTLIKLGVSGLCIVGVGAAWAYKKFRGQP